jgi:hypothetical protein
VTGREVFQSIYDGGRPDRLPVQGVGPWRETLDRWRTEGLGATESHNAALGLESDDVIGLPLNLSMAPLFPIRVLQTDESYVVLVDEFGVTKRLMRADFDRTQGLKSRAGDASSMAQWLDFPVKDLRSWKELFGERFRSELAGRVPADWPARSVRLREEAQTRWVWYFGFPFFGLFGPLRELMGYEGLVFAMADQPSLVHEMVRDLTAFRLAVFAQALRDAPLDQVTFFEDICATKAPLLSPAMFREFLAPGYRATIGGLRDMGVTQFHVDTDGNAWDLIPEMLACGVTGLNPCEVASGMDVAALRARFPTLCLSGGIDKRAFVAGPRAIDLELDRCFRVAWNAGGYTPAPDHGIPPDVSWANIQHYAQRYRQGCGHWLPGGCAP